MPDLSTKGLLTSRLTGAIDPLDAVIGPDPTDLRSLPRPETPWTHAVADLGAPLRVAWSPTMGFADGWGTCAEQMADVAHGLG